MRCLELNAILFFYTAFNRKTKVSSNVDVAFKWDFLGFNLCFVVAHQQGSSDSFCCIVEKFALFFWHLFLSHLTNQSRKIWHRLVWIGLASKIFRFNHYILLIWYWLHRSKTHHTMSHPTNFYKPYSKILLKLLSVVLNC